VSDLSGFDKTETATSSVPEKVEVKQVKVKVDKAAEWKHEEYEVITIKDGQNIHKTIKNETALYQKERFVVPRSIGDKLRKRIRFLVVLKTVKDKPDAPVTLNTAVPISSSLLYTVESSGTLRNALAGLFKQPLSMRFPGKKILFFGILIVVIAVAYFVYTGQLNLGGIIKL